ncbi:hypothetical protein L917_19898 [Phytophthora nicotianae]|uniref:F-box domain-containing protein n=2 Tax=Phytophthora nicotianae TaxID=4792 RepID=V9E2G4_PHYNI|nr:hypothetical protein F443_20748 [Phytophthora nicotianae P1569]ETK72821.1 hypothetical protein L915_20169 [Phytophthora nicotianae]ETL26274.1 hypothetical protein L916_20036 [Phytophthora nicotianae]ETL79493.1 hypothetical protein L917_19898 [Phytophthora nicotianae]ETM32745.1 hypothetical protein L914_19928 [Phytophthora nicotianae]
MVLHARVLNYTRTQLWRIAASLSGGWYLSFAIMSPQYRLVALCVGVAAYVCVEFLLAFASEAQQCLTTGASARSAQYSQKNSALLQLPKEVQFEIAEFLGAEDLLIARVTCHKVNNALKSESARFWLHARLRRRLRGQSNLYRTRSYNTGLRIMKYAKQFVHEAVVLVLAKIIRTGRDPVQILRSSNESDCVLKWVYLNADWIRKQNLPSLVKDDESGNDGLIKLSKGDVGFNVFRYFPSKTSSGIILISNDDFVVERVEVPRKIYAMIQEDPFTFTAAETRSAPEISNWYLALVAFAAMTLIFVAQHCGDVLLY